MSTGNRIRYYREKLGWRQKDLADRSGVHQGTISALEKRGSDRSKFLGVIANAMGLTAEQLADEDHDWLEGVQPEPATATFNLLDVQAAAGAGVAARDELEVLTQVHVSLAWARETFGTNFARIKLITARGTSMQGTIENNDILFVDAGVNYYDGDGIYVIARGSDVQVKRLQKLHGDKLLIISDNKAHYKTEELTPDQANDVVVCGRVVASWTKKTFW